MDRARVAARIVHDLALARAQDGADEIVTHLEGGPRVPRAPARLRQFEASGLLVQQQDRDAVAAQKALGFVAYERRDPVDIRRRQELFRYVVEHRKLSIFFERLRRQRAVLDAQLHEGIEQVRQPRRVFTVDVADDTAVCRNLRRATRFPGRVARKDCAARVHDDEVPKLPSRDQVGQ
jgi:hypothetical protein